MHVTKLCLKGIKCERAFENEGVCPDFNTKLYEGKCIFTKIKYQTGFCDFNLTQIIDVLANSTCLSLGTTKLQCPSENVTMYKMER